MEELFGIQFGSRSGTWAEFTVPNTETVHNNWEQVLAVLTFYSVALLETASTPDGFFTYIKDGQECRKNIPEACRDFLTTVPIASNEYGEDAIEEDGEDAIEENVSGDEASEPSNLVAPIRTPYDYIIDRQIKPTHIPPHSWAVGRYSKATTTYTARGYTHGGQVGTEDSFVRDHGTHLAVLAKITSIEDRHVDIAAILGDHIDPDTVSATETEISPGVNEIIFNMDRFRVQIERVDPDYYFGRFTPWVGLHHAASMIAQPCTVMWTETKVRPLLVPNEIELSVVARTPEIITIETEYMGLDCL